MKNIFKHSLLIIGLMTFFPFWGTGLYGQKSKEKVSYKSVEVSFGHHEMTEGDSVMLAGTLTIPKKMKAPVPVVVLITGSGAQDRDENILGFKLFQVIANHLSNNGIAVLRVDDRGFGQSTGKSVGQSTTQELAEDTKAAIAFLRKEPRVDPEKIFLLGHSEGGTIAPLVASQDPAVAGIICMAGTGVTGAELLVEQNSLILDAMGIDSAAKAQAVADQAEALEVMKTGQGYEAWAEKHAKIYGTQWDEQPEEKREMMGSREAYIEKMMKQADAQIKSTWMTFFVNYDPYPALTKVKCPTLLLFGSKDLQVPPHQNREPMEKALKEGGNSDFKTIIYPDANHLFQKAITGSPTEYAVLEKKFVDGFLDDILQWLNVKNK